jgi:hypothetical protein
VVWNTLVHPKENILFIEVRSESERQVSFHAINLDTRTWLIQDLKFEEPWWVSLGEVSQNVVLFKLYTDTNNPDRKSVIAYDFIAKKIIWWRNNYAISGVHDDAVLGSEAALGMKFLALGLQDGLPLERETISHAGENFLVRKPLQYFQETSHFETVKSFIQVQFGMLPVSIVEYLEVGQLVCMSFYVGEKELANYLIVLRTTGEVILNERIGEQLKGIGMDTFFLLSGYLIFAKNKRELVSYKMV